MKPTYQTTIRINIILNSPLRNESCVSPDRQEIAYAESVSLDWKSGALAEGLECYQNSEFFLAHEHWESVWLRSDEPEKSFLQALIQTTAAFHHFRAGNAVGATSLLKRALQRLDLCPECFGGIDVISLRMEIRAWVRKLESSSWLIPLSFPQICPTDPSPEATPGD
jgi:predicted metal-dependent hydrolase